MRTPDASSGHVTTTQTYWILSFFDSDKIVLSTNLRAEACSRRQTPHNKQAAIQEFNASNFASACYK